jgi:Ca-activated chloride channel family protein
MKLMAHVNEVSSAPRLESRAGVLPVLEGVRLRAELEDLLGRVRVEQRFANRERVPIEAVYTFPVPVGAVLLGFSARLGDKELTARVLPAPEAHNNYEDAVAQGDAAILLQEAAPGLYTVNLGNVLPGQEVALCYQYAQLQHWQDDSLRFVLPTVVAPRYGDPLAAGLQPHQVPEANLLVERGVALEVVVRGTLAQAEIFCPSHAIRLEPRQDEVRLHFDGAPERAMDRDIVLILRRADSPPAAVQVEDEEDGTRTALLTVRPELPGSPPAGPRFLKILVDASGSMQGDSIAQAREALLRILDSLAPGDLFTIMAFGSRHHFLTPPVVPVEPGQLERARNQVMGLRADLGGTELGQALRALLDLQAEGEMPQDVLLITDGEVNDNTLVEEARRRGQRIFTVGVGCAPGESLLARLSQATGGAAEFVTPGDQVAERILRHFRRIQAPRLRRLRLQWPCPVREERRDRDGGLFAGDTVQILAHLDGAPAGGPAGEVELEFIWEDGTRQTRRAGLRPVRHLDGAVSGASLLARLLAAAELRAHTHVQPDKQKRQRLVQRALRGQLLSPWTACLLVDVRDEAERTNGQPVLRVVPQMLAAGWHGAGTVLNCELPMRRNMPVMARPALSQVRCRDMGSNRGFHGPDALLDGFPIDRLDLAALAAFGVPLGILGQLRALVDAGHDEGSVCLLALQACLNAGLPLALDRDRKRRLRREARQLTPDPALAAWVAEIVARATGLGND